MLRPSSRTRPIRYLFLLLTVVLLLPTMTAAAQTEPEKNDDAIVPISITLSLSSIVDPGRTWIDAAGLHTRDLIATAAVEGDFTGTAEITTDLDWSSPCDAESSTCQGAIELLSTVEVHSDGRTWAGPLALEFVPDSRSQAHGILIGRHGAGDQVIIFDEVTADEDDETITLSGRTVTLTGPIAGVHLTFSACITGPATADGGFIGTSGLIVDSGPARISLERLGTDGATGLYSNVRYLGHKGNLTGFFTARLQGRHAYGNFVLAGETGPYRGILGYGRAMATLTDEPRCASGIQLNGTWTGQARHLIDPATFLAPRVFFASPENGAVVSTPVVFELGAEHVEIDAAGQARDGAGYLTVIVDAPCVGPGEPMPVDDQHIHLSGGETSIELNLFTGQYRLCLQLTDGAGIALPATDVIRIRVAASGPDDPGGF